VAGRGTGTRWARSRSAAGLALLVLGRVPPEPKALTVDGPPETAPNGDALIPKAKATEGEQIRTSRFQAGESQMHTCRLLKWSCCIVRGMRTVWPERRGDLSSAISVCGGLRQDMASRIYLPAHHHGAKVGTD
jgi:hypothetical protein